MGERGTAILSARNRNAAVGFARPDGDTGRAVVMIPWQLQLGLNIFGFLMLGALAGWVLHRWHVALVLLVVSFLSLLIPLGIEHAAGRLPLSTSLQEFLNGFYLVANLFVLFFWFPAVVGVLMSRLGRRWLHRSRGNP